MKGLMNTNTQQRQVDCGNGVISYQLTRKKVKNVNLRIKQDGRVFVSANRRVPIEFIEDFIRQKQEFILSTLAKYEEQRNLHQDTPKSYVSGESYELLGKSLCLKVEESQDERIYLDGGYIILKVKDKDNFRHKEIMMNKWLKEYQMTVFHELIDKTYIRMQKYDVPYPILKIRCMKSRWGSCQPQRGIITLNSCLIAAPIDCIEYVVLHELVHFVHPNHSKQFWSFVAMLMPDWKERKKRLERSSLCTMQ